MTEARPDSSVGSAALSSPAVAPPEAAATAAAEGEGVTEGEAVPPEFECSICMKILMLPVTTPCGHNFCRSCIEQALIYRPMCPLCRAPLLYCTLPEGAPGGHGGRTTLRVNTLLQQLLEAQYPQMMAKRLADAAADAVRTAANESTRTEGEADQQQQQMQMLPLFFAMGEQLQRQMRQQQVYRGPGALQTCPLMPGEKMVLHIHEQRYIHLVQLALQGSHHFGIILPPVEQAAVGIRLPQTPGRNRGATEFSGAAGASPAAASRVEELDASEDVGVFGCCVEIEQHSLAPPNLDERAIGACLIRCVCKNRFRLVDIMLPQDEQQQQQPLETLLAAAVASPDFSVGACYPVVDAPLIPPPHSAGQAATPAAPHAATATANDSEEAQHQELHYARATAEEWSRNPLSRSSNLSDEFASVKALLMRDHGGEDSAGSSGTLSLDIRLAAARRLCEICTEGLSR
ncbi:uncharacterized protein LOC34618076 [Cyclospora cayetanensis]|uniref:Uncharacterized protein LOC34618076 n=1 Tax=Cyclospora cayetanensis TaxID=88456 RepID=A0A6P6RY24_9EIME|nr:uncharacterized protein LOC34618076 [Cyclospora cayetanensis]